VIAFLSPSITNVMIVIGLTSWMSVTRLVRAEFLSLTQREFVTASTALGAQDWRVIFRHCLPNSLTPVLVSVVLGIASAVLLESGLSFLGLGVQAPQASWGNILTDGKEYIQFAWWLSLYPGLAILITVLGIASAVLLESGLSFLGLGVQAPQASWGNILTDGKEYIQFAWWLSLYPGLAILITVLGYNLLGEGLRDVFDPRSNTRR
jgi:ABC-type dipeptide/oligopeptide/nickel transport system permease subunit